MPTGTEDAESGGMENKPTGTCEYPNCDRPAEYKVTVSNHGREIVAGYCPTHVDKVAAGLADMGFALVSSRKF